jgi:hypothetical protein
MMEDWFATLMVVITLVMIIGSLSTFEKSSKHKLRKKGLNDREETIPRSKKSQHKMETIPKNHSSTKN